MAQEGVAELFFRAPRHEQKNGIPAMPTGERRRGKSEQWGARGVSWAFQTTEIRVVHVGRSCLVSGAINHPGKSTAPPPVYFYFHVQEGRKGG